MDSKVLLGVQVFTPILILVGNDNRQTDRWTYSIQKEQTLIKMAQIKTSEMLGVHKLNTRMMSVSDNNDRQTDIWTCIIQKAQTHIECSNQIGQKR